MGITGQHWWNQITPLSWSYSKRCRSENCPNRFPKLRTLVRFPSPGLAMRARVSTAASRAGGTRPRSTPGCRDANAHDSSGCASSNRIVRGSRPPRRRRRHDTPPGQGRRCVTTTPAATSAPTPLHRTPPPLGSPSCSHVSGRAAGTRASRRLSGRHRCAIARAHPLTPHPTTRDRPPACPPDCRRRRLLTRCLRQIVRVAARRHCRGARIQDCHLQHDHTPRFVGSCLSIMGTAVRVVMVGAASRLDRE